MLTGSGYRLFASLSLLLAVTVGSGAAAEQAGLRADFFAGRLPSGERVATFLESGIDHAWGTGSPDVRVPVDGFSARWSGTLTAPATGTYTLFATSDDGIRVWIGGTLIIDRWVDQAASTTSAMVNLTSETAVALRVEYYENGGLATTRLEWQGPGLPRQVIPTAALRCDAPVPLLPPGAGRGLRGQYYRGIDFTSQVFGRIDPVVNFDWFLGSPATGLAPDRFSVRWTGQILPRATDTYTFYVRSDDGVQLWVGGQLLVDQLQLQAAKTWSGTIALTAGQPADIRLDYFENYGLASAQLFWSSPTQPREIIPASQLFYPDTTPPAAPAPIAYGRDGGVTLIWPRPSDDVGAERYVIERDGTVVGTTAALEFTDTGLATDSRHTYRIAAEDGSGNRSAWSVALVVTVPPSAVPTGTGTGLAATYFSTTTLVTPVLSRLDPVIDFAWGAGSPAATAPPDRFSARWEGFIQARYSENYTFALTVDDGARLWVDDRLLIDAWRDQAARTYITTVPLGAGEFHRLRLEYYENAGQAVCQLAWSSPREAFGPIPTTQLYPALPDTPSVITALQVAEHVTGTHTAVAVTATDDHPALSYAWTITGPAPATSADAAAANTTATFTAVGVYHVGIRVTDSAGQSAVATREVMVIAVPTQVAVTAPVAIDQGAAVTCTAQISDQFGASLAAVPTWTASAGSITSAGLFTAPTAAGDVTVTAQADTATGQAVIRVRAVPVITWATPVAIPWGTALSTNQLSASTSIPGIFTYAPAVGTVPEVGSQALAVTFVPTDGVTYQTAMATVVQVVTKALSTVT